ncbi:MAG: hypothetical protein GIW94_12350 [Candidatus Eremiobacteraeota bacterium]|nr:hypothetical protein [Candidatus Eremiobacteraeota bacterium]MBC5822495.1 hypothetical protein [Candidatus Eremiobacteraeota bacterium]
MFVAKGIPHQFVRGTPSPDERALIAQAAATVPKARTGLDPKVLAYTNALVSACASIAGLVLRGGSVPALASNVAIGGLSPLATFGSNDLLANGLAGAGCSTIFGGGH